MADKKLIERVEELERRVKELEARPRETHHHYHYEYHPPVIVPFVQPYAPDIFPPYRITCGSLSAGEAINWTPVNTAIGNYSH